MLEVWPHCYTKWPQCYSEVGRMAGTHIMRRFGPCVRPYNTWWLQCNSSVRPHMCPSGIGAPAPSGIPGWDKMGRVGQQNILERGLRATDGLLVLIDLDWAKPYWALLIWPTTHTKERKKNTRLSERHNFPWWCYFYISVSDDVSLSFMLCLEHEKNGRIE